MTAETVEISGYIAGTWDVDPVHLHVGFVARHLMVSKVRGSFPGAAMVPTAVLRCINHSRSSRWPRQCQGRARQCRRSMQPSPGNPAAPGYGTGSGR
jgi:hypothetical protein